MRRIQWENSKRERYKVNCPNCGAVWLVHKSVNRGAVFCPGDCWDQYLDKQRAQGVKSQ